MSVIGIIGAGPAGMMTAIIAARKGHRVLLFEGNDRVGKKILVTGNGRCNLSNLNMNAQSYHSSSLDTIAPFLKAFGVKETIQFFKELGVYTKDREGYLYPNSDQASTILDAFRYELAHYPNITLYEEHKVTAVNKSQDGKYNILFEKKKYQTDVLVLSCGGKAAPKTGSDGSGYQLAKNFGHKIVPVYPALVQLVCKEDFMKSISGVRCNAKVSFFTHDNKLIKEECGELQLTDYGVSGIPVFQCSGAVNQYLNTSKQPVNLHIDFFPSISEGEWQEQIKFREEHMLDRTAEEYYFGLLNKKITQLCLRLHNIKPNRGINQIDRVVRTKIFNTMRDFQLTIHKSKGFDQAQVCTGGVSMSEVDTHLQSKICPNLYFAGEILDVDGKCGGYNLQWAFTSGFIVGDSI